MGMKTCLGSLLLIPTLAAVVLTVIYHASVNGELRFEQRDTHTEYINTTRSYRPPIPQQERPRPVVTEAALPNMQDDEAAEEVEP